MINLGQIKKFNQVQGHKYSLIGQINFNMDLIGEN